MSFRAMLKHRCRVLSMSESSEDGVPVIGWDYVRTNGQPAEYRCFLDLNFIRRGKDPQWTPEAGRPADRTGVFFAFDEAWTPSVRHHIEIGVIEVASQMARVQYRQT
jgi:hypothetical protein